MKLIIAIVQPNRLEHVKEALTEVEVFRLTVLDCLGFGRQKGQKNALRGHDGSINLLRKLQLQIAVNDEFVEPTIQAILKAAKSEGAGQIEFEPANAVRKRSKNQCSPWTLPLPPTNR